MLTVRHRSASGDLQSMWEVDPLRRAVDLVFRVAAGPSIAATILVCHPDRPIANAHPILRVNGESWKILPAIFLPTFSASRDRARYGFAHLACVSRTPCDLHDAIGIGTLILTNCPPDQDRELEELCNE